MELRSLGQRLQEARAVADVSRKQLSDHTQLDITAISRIENNRYNWDQDFLYRAGECLGIEVYKLLLPVDPTWQPYEGKSMVGLMTELFHAVRGLEPKHIRWLLMLAQWLVECHGGDIVSAGPR